ncbi:hypothetical protein KY5_6147c [Streptomyces formicae]|uniref:Uncharacterized protein n=1 Tax=Streptomyces formicae TaxID=1616117 RepID=A0A291QI96_9ACTN|nr:hypothetical protein KY5_6147c [Streptomyces formicae]
MRSGAMALEARRERCGCVNCGRAGHAGGPPPARCEAVRRLKVETVEDFGMGKVPCPDSYPVAQEVEELTNAP